MWRKWPQDTRESHQLIARHAALGCVGHVTRARCCVHQLDHRRNGCVETQAFNVLANLGDGSMQLLLDANISDRCAQDVTSALINRQSPRALQEAEHTNNIARVPRL